jgi:CrcB protein
VTTAIGIAVLGALGSLARWGTQTAMNRVFPRFPYGTLLVNILGSAAIGFVMALFAARHELESRTRVALTAGLLGGFTTYSSFAFDSLELVERGQIAGAIGYVLSTVVICFLACAGGVLLARSL